MKPLRLAGDILWLSISRPCVAEKPRSLAGTSIAGLPPQLLKRMPRPHACSP